MRPLLLALALIPFAAAQAHDEHEHGSLGKHEHGVAQLNVALDGGTLELEVDSPAMNFVGFEHPASSAADQATVAAARAQLGKPLELVQAPAAAKCGVTEVELESPLFGNAKAEDHDDDGDEHEGHQHSDINAHYKLACAAPEALTGLDFAPLFKRFPGTQKLVVQLIGPNGQQGAELTPASSLLKF
ncbi:DUF2796 domain-containing protein [Pseudomonas delhiensis]|uniref:DUF2796 domain-containing protein n=1 Tax=Pseudomonas delhiensis TaxID=366289 RepID=UPI003159A781